MAELPSLEELTEDMAAVVPTVDAKTNGQYGDGLGSEDEERQIKLILNHLRSTNERYESVEREVAYPELDRRCDLVLPTGIPVEAKLIRYWRANGDPEPAMYGHVFSPFHRNTLLTDARRLHASEFGEESGLLGLFYTRADSDPKAVEALPDRYTAANIAEKVVREVDYWYEAEASVCRIAKFDGLQHTVHGTGAAISWIVE
ncbi:transcriptional regulator [Haloarchaeobius litoreus]|uniref:Restriction endonuclease n=1 Tax=Haloarchaeobius litoreus TaxID=755306 RepID=A0ABD6DRR0_9EURY|nr:transcriptional regulator [Haloarchaeobius litoreus]